jgi:hypothetical protein
VDKSETHKRQQACVRLRSIDHTTRIGSSVHSKRAESNKEAGVHLDLNLMLTDSKNPKQPISGENLSIEIKPGVD